MTDCHNITFDSARIANCGIGIRMIASDINVNEIHMVDTLIGLVPEEGATFNLRNASQTFTKTPKRKGKRRKGKR